MLASLCRARLAERGNQVSARVHVMFGFIGLSATN
jgi:hypothetical protein